MMGITGGGIFTASLLCVFTLFCIISKTEHMKAHKDLFTPIS